MSTYSISPTTLLKSLCINANLIYILAKRDIVLRYRGSMIGICWSILVPLFMLFIYSFVYGVVLKVKWIGHENQAEFALIIFAGLIVFNFFSECISRSATVIISNASYVKKVVFPLEIFPFIIFLTAFFQLVVSFSVWLVFYFFIYGLPHITVLYFPIVLVPIAFFIMGTSWFLAALGVYLRDMSHIITLLLSMLMLMTPIFFPLSAIPERYRHALSFDPLTVIMEQVRGVLIFGEIPDGYNLLWFTAIYGVLAWIGFVCFQKMRKGFADVL